MQSRRQFGQALLAGIPAALAYGAVSSKFGGVQIGAISYSFRSLPADQILAALVKAGVSEVELMSNHAEALIGAPAVTRTVGGIANPEGQTALQKWRATVSMDKYKDLRKSFDAGGVNIQLLCYNLAKGCSDDEI